MTGISVRYVYDWYLYGISVPYDKQRLKGRQAKTHRQASLDSQASNARLTRRQATTLRHARKNSKAG
jgi:hypothetical protein